MGSDSAADRLQSSLCLCFPCGQEGWEAQACLSLAFPGVAQMTAPNQR